MYNYKLMVDTNNVKCVLCKVGSQIKTGSEFICRIICYDQLFGPHREKTCLGGFRQSLFQTSLLSYRLARKLKFHL